jgi:hypothetical protein
MQAGEQLDGYAVAHPVRQSILPSRMYFGLQCGLERRRGCMAGTSSMTPVSPVMPGSESIEIVLGKDQPEYVPLPAVYLDTAARPMITRWRLSDEERAMIASGADVVLQQLTFRCLVQPVNLQIVMPGDSPIFVEEPA